VPLGPDLQGCSGARSESFQPRHSKTNVSRQLTMTGPVPVHAWRRRAVLPGGSLHTAVCCDGAECLGITNSPRVIATSRDSVDLVELHCPACASASTQDYGMIEQAFRREAKR
jgi:hypothetical protein